MIGQSRAVPGDKEVLQRLKEARANFSRYPQDDVLAVAARRIATIPDPKERICALVSAKQLYADWDGLAEEMGQLLGHLEAEEEEHRGGGLVAGSRLCLKPMAALYLPLPAAVTREAIVRYFDQLVRSLPAPAADANVPARAGEPPFSSLSAPRVLRVGYVGAEFGSQSGPAGTSLSGAWRVHNRTRVSVYLYALNSGGDREAHLSRGDHVRDLTSSIDLEGAAEVVLADQLDIVVFFSGHGVTAGTRLEGLCAMRLAPVVVFAQGYMGTAGNGKLVDWSISDRVLTPPVTVGRYYLEKVAMMPEGRTFFASPHAEMYPLTEVTKLDRQGSDGSSVVVLSCFNQIPKIDIQSFEAWMRIMKRVPKSVLWLFAMRGESEGPERLRRHALLLDVDPERIYFFPLMPEDTHVWTKSKADLFLDTAVYGAHTTAADALWGGVPVVTKAGALPQSRVAASLLTSLGLPWLVTRTWEEYEETVVRLATDRKLLDIVRERVRNGRQSLLSPKRWAKAVEKKFHAMVEVKKARAGEGSLHLF